MKRTILLSIALPAIVAGLALFPFKNNKERFHTPAELAFLRQHAPFWLSAPDAHLLLPIDSSILFPTAKVCSGCHGSDPTGKALVDNSGVDINMYDDWRSSMMANSARDPFWRAKVTHESLVNPSHSLVLQDKCTSCHAPAGHYQAKLKRHQEYYTLAEVYADSLGLDGVTCQACHAQPKEKLGILHSGELNFDTNKVRVSYGPYEFVFAPPMHNFVGITPKYSLHILDGGLCAGCHTLITNSVDLSGQLTGKTFVEQATYHEWLNSRYDKQHDKVACQKCHLPQIPDEVIISKNYQFLTPKYPYGLHEMAGANVTMLKLMKENRAALGISAEAEHYDSTIAATLRMLQEKSLTLTLTPGVLNGDTAYFKLKLNNKAGHKFPSGYPARRAWVEFVVENAAGDTVFHSGRFASDYSLPDEDKNYETHYDVIRQPEQVQIYELVPGDVTGAFTNVLERAHIGLKDNRLTPQGFTLSDPVYDTTQIIGAALTDPDFNRFDDGKEGSGSDVLHFHIPISGYTGRLKVSAKVWYQSLPPKWMAPLFEYSSPEIDTFRQMFDAADRSPVLVAYAALDSLWVTPVSTHENALASIRVAPTLSRDGLVRVFLPQGVALQRVRAWDARGQMVWDNPGATTDIRLPGRKGIYIVSVETNRGRKTAKVLRD